MDNEKILNLKKESFYVVLPRYIFQNDFIPSSAKNLYWLIKFLDSDKKHCYASNEYLSKILRIETRTVVRSLKLLEDWKYIKVNNKKSKYRNIEINDSVIEIYSQAGDDVHFLSKQDISLKDQLLSAKNIFLKALDTINGDK